MSSPTPADLAIYYTGGGSNSTPSASIGGAMSSARVLHQSTTGLSLVTGVTIDDAIGNTLGAGFLTWTPSTTSMTWSPYLGSTGTPVVITTDGRYTIQGAAVGDGALLITVVAASLPGSTTTDTITVANLTDKYFVDLTKAETLAGVTKYHCFAVKNIHASGSILNLYEWIAANTPGQDTITIYLDPVAAGNGSSTYPAAVANENTAPAGAVFVNPVSVTDSAVLNYGTLTYGQVRFVWYKQLVPANCTTATLANTFNPGRSFIA